MITIAVKTVRGRKYSYILKQDEKGYFWDGMECLSFRRKTRSSIEKRANLFKFDIVDIEGDPTASQGQVHSHGGRGVPKWRGRMIQGAGFDSPLKENLTDCVNDSEQQVEGIEIGEASEYEFEYSLL